MNKFPNYRATSHRIFLIMTAITALSFNALAQAPSGYYDSANGLTGQALADALHEIIDDHTRYPYTASTTDVWDILTAADEDPNNSSNILSIYKNESKGFGNWNREHSWPKSLGFPDDGNCNYPYTDAHHLFAADINYNSARSNKPFDNCFTGCTEYPAVNATTSNWTAGDFTDGSWEVWDDKKGDIARAMFYMAVRYNGGTHGATGCSEPDLILTDNRSLITNYSSNQSQAYMGMLSVLIAWHNADPVDSREQDRNNVVYSFQGNRNPFVDNPQWVTAIFGTGNGGGGTPGGGNPGGGNPGGGNPSGGNPWINEIHYDNNGTDSLEGVEVAGPSGTDLTGWSLVAYNGSGGAQYATVNLSGTLPNQENGFGTAWFTVSGLQNGSPDGIALVDDGGSVVQFLSYEGSFTATDGPASGMTATDIGVSEAGDSLVGHSLQLGGTGNDYADFTWETSALHTNGDINNTQTFEPSGSGGGPVSGDPWINEIHYDNDGGDLNEGVEIAGPSGTDLSGWSLVAYNGSVQTAYATVNLSGTLSDQQNGLGTAWFSFSGLQNGSPDGIALVDPSNRVVQFLSYEGSFTATDGPASGITSTDIGVSEPSTSPVGHSLQLGGTGQSYADFTWQAAGTHTNGTVNSNQTFTGGSGSSQSNDPWINEIHYDNSGTDLNEGVEIAGPAGLDLSGYQLVAYNGSNGQSYATINLSGTIDNEGNGMGALWFAFAGLQNGSPDGIALIDPSDNVIQFLSYEGSFNATAGAASGMTSTDIGVSESSGASSSQSLQLTGTGNSAGDFTWSGPANHSRGSLNSGQNIN